MQHSSSLLFSAEQKFTELLVFHQLPLDLQKKSAILPVVKAIALSDFVADQLRKQPKLFSEWLDRELGLADATDYATRLQQGLSTVQNEAEFFSVLRQFRHREMAVLSYLQSNHFASPQEIFERLSDLAESIVLGARDWLFRQMCTEYGTPMDEQGQPQELLILGMGKLGGRELNFSSDIDLIFTYAELGETVGGRKAIDNSKFFIRLGQRLIRALDENTPEGFVYRVDMRLRPFGESGALVMSFAALEEYYQEQGRDWERYAMIKAKILGEDLGKPNHRYLKSLLRPFVYRRYLDFSAIQSLREMKQKISREVLRRGLIDNIKLGAGGIREVEFIVQSFQMIRGGRDKILQQRSLLTVLPQLETLALLSEDQVTDLRVSYLFLRHTENVLQAIGDQQTQRLPTNAQDRTRLVFATQSENWEDFLARLNSHQAKVRAVFHDIIGDDEEDLQNTATNCPLTLWKDVLNEQMSLEELIIALQQYAVNEQDYTEIYQQFSARFQEWLKRPIGVRGREALHKLLPKIADQVFSQPDYTVRLPRVLNIVDKITTRTTYLELLLEKEQILPRLLALCGQSVMIAEQIARYPMLLDELLGNGLTQVIALNQYTSSLHEYLLRIPDDDEEALIDGLRQFKQSQLLHIAAADILGVLPVMKISDHLTYLAEAILNAVVNLAWKQTAVRFGVPEHLAEHERDFVVVGYGKLGGIELGYHSDLDLVFLHNAPEDSQTVGGKKAISSHQFYLKLAQKINGIFSLNTSAGVLYEVDMRLRPSGEAGLLVSTFNAYEQYQQNEAWTWELQALVRARAVYGSSALREKFEHIRRKTLSTQRATGQLRQEIYKMREKMYSHLSSANPSLFQLKADRGGITDIEFIAQFLVLNYAHRYPKMAVWSDNVRIFERSVECDILSQSEGESLKKGYTTLRNQLHHLNLLNKEATVPAGEFMQERATVGRLWKKLLG